MNDISFKYLRLIIYTKENIKMKLVIANKCYVFVSNDIIEYFLRCSFKLCTCMTQVHSWSLHSILTAFVCFLSAVCVRYPI